MIAVLFSFEQKCFHIETMTEYIKSNWSVSINKKDHQYRLVGIAENWDDAHKYCDKLENIEPFKSIRLEHKEKYLNL
jgi:hypothetical protein